MADPAHLTGGSRAVLRAGLLLFAILLPCAVLEGVLRWQGYQAFQWSDRVNTQIVMATDNEELPYVLVPGAQGWGWDTQISVNSHGFRDREYSEEKGGRFRIAAFGDSITFGSRLPEEAVFAKQLERLLQSESAGAEVLNFGVTGFDVVNNVEHFRVRALPFRPDVALLALCANDIGTSSTAMEYIRVAKYLDNPVFRLRLAQYVLSTGLRYAAVNQAALANDLDAFARINRGRILAVSDDRTLVAQVDRLARTDRNRGLSQWWTELPRIGYLEYAFDKLSALKSEHGFEVIVISIPMLEPSEVRRWRLVHEIIRHETLKFGFDFVDVFEDFEKAGLRKLRNEPTDPIHPDKEGHAIVARRVQEHLRSHSRLGQ
jgi:lysophospholipase L1-like esterase